MKLFKKMKVGGKDSTITGYFLIEWKSIFSIVLLKFEGKSREAFHTHAFNSISWLLNGCLMESWPNKELPYFHIPSWKPIYTYISDFHKVDSINAKSSWVLSFRGPWKDSWLDHDISTGITNELTHGRVIKK